MVTLLKVHGSQNQFFILDQTQLKHPLSKKELISLTKKITKPKKGLLGGADGLLIVNRPQRKGALAQMHVINADGSIASMCGNGLRTVARYISEKKGRNQFKIDTMNANLRVDKQKNLAPGVPAFAVEISPVRFQHKALPFAHVGLKRIVDQFVPELYPGLRFTAIAVPNPHLISFMSRQTLEGPILGQLGEKLNRPNPYFPEGVNVNFAQILGPNKIFVHTFERGVGFTNACGTGMSATALALCLTHPESGSFEKPIEIFNPGGEVKVIAHYGHNQYWIQLSGNATFTHQIRISEKDLHHCRLNKVKIKVTGEQTAYENFVNQLPRFNNLRTL